MMPMPPDTHKISLKVIEAVKQHPVLYITEVKSSVIKLQEFRQKVWTRISNQLGLDSTWVKLRWKNLRDTYCRILKYKNKTDKGVRRKKWIFEDHLSFLKFPYESDYEPQCVVLSEEYVKEINDGVLSSDDLLEQLEDRNDEDYSEYLELEETTADPTLGTSKLESKIATKNISHPLSESDEPSPKKPNLHNYAQEIESKYRKIRPKRSQIEESVEVSNFNILQSPNANNDSSQKAQNNFARGQNQKNGNLFSESAAKPIFIANPTSQVIQSSARKSVEFCVENESREIEKQMKSSLELFFDSMAQTVKKLPSKVQADIKMDICRIVTEAEVRFSKNIVGKNNESPKSTVIPKLVLIPCSMIDKQKK